MKPWCSRPFQLRDCQKEIVSSSSKPPCREASAFFLNFDIGLKLLNQGLQPENECFSLFQYALIASG